VNSRFEFASKDGSGAIPSEELKVIRPSPMFGTFKKPKQRRKENDEGKIGE
jgi:hypothetical protein